MRKGNSFLLYILGLKINQELFNRQEDQYKNKVAFLKESYVNAVKYLLVFAESQGVRLILDDDMKLLKDNNPPEDTILYVDDFRFTGGQLGSDGDE